MAMLNKSLYTVIFFISILIGQNTKPTVAILDFEGQGVDASEVQTLSERMRTEIGNTNAVRLIERKAVEKIMMEQGLQQSGCTTDECAAEVGQLLGVQFMISGSIGKMGKSYTIDIKMFSVETGETERTANSTFKGEIDGLLIEIEILAWEIMGMEPPTSLKLKREGDQVLSTLAVMDFEGRGIPATEAQTLTDRLITELSRTKKVILVERSTMNDVLNEQGYETAGCTSDECAAEVGALLGVDLMISGAIGKIGNTFTIDAKMFKVSTGAAENMKNITYQGEVDGLIIEIEILAWQILGLTPPKNLIKKKRRGMTGLAANTPLPKTKGGAIFRSIIVPGLGQIYGNYNKAGWAYLGTELLCVGLTATSINNYNAAQTEYNIALNNYRNAKTAEDIAKYKTESTTAITSMDDANKMSLTFSVLAGLVWGASVIHSAMVAPNDLGYDINKNVILAYNPKTQSAQLSFSFSI
jgi:TolB-like protein/TM2 domain-containing membrane protein YozV